MGTTHYCDPSAASDGNGTYTSPWKYLSSVNNHTFATGDDLYFKVGTTLTVPAGQYLNITWNGSASDHVVIGAYYGNGLFGLNGGARPILNGSANLAPARDSEVGLVTKHNSLAEYPTLTRIDAYIDIKDLKVEYSGFTGIYLYGLSHVTVKNCYVDRPWMSQGIGVYRCDDAIIGGASADGNILTRLRYGGFDNGCGLVLGGVDELLMTNSLVSYNRIDGSSEGIGTYGKASNIIVEHNVVRDTVSYYYYCCGGNSIDFRYNIAYRSATGPTATVAYALDVESWMGYTYTEQARFYGNVAANIQSGFMVGNDKNTTAYKGIRIFNNTIVDPVNYSFEFWNQISVATVLKNNISYLLGRGIHYLYHYSGTGVSWDFNNFSDSSDNPSDANKVVGVPTLSKTSGWRTIAADAEDIDDWNILAGSNCIDTGTHLTTISATEATANATMPVTDGYWFGRGMFVAVDNDADGVIDFTDTVVSVDYTAGAFVVTLANAHTFCQRARHTAHNTVYMPLKARESLVLRSVIQ